MVKQVKVSIICVTYNAEKYLANFLESIKKYKTEACELIIFDGKSTDQTLQIISKYQSFVDQCISEKDEGIYDAMNKSIAYANGKWLYFIGADDELCEDFPEFVNRIKDPNTIYHGNILMDNEIIVRSADAYRLAKENISHQTLFYPAKVFKEYQYNKIYKICADYELNLKLRGNQNYRFEYIPLTPAKFGTDGLSSSKRDDLFEDGKANIVRKHLGYYVYFRLLFKQFKLNRDQKS